MKSWEHGAGNEWSTGEELPEEPLKDLSVEEIMTGEIISILPSLPLREIAKLLAERHIHRVFVTEGNEPVGVISTMDVLGAMAGVKPSKVRA